MQETYTLILFQTGETSTIDVYTFSDFDNAQNAMDLIGKTLWKRLNKVQDVAIVTNRDNMEIHNSHNPRVKYAKLQIVYTNSDPSDQQILDNLKPLY